MPRGKRRENRLGGTATVAMGIYQAAFGAAYANFMARFEPPENDVWTAEERVKKTAARWGKAAREYARAVAADAVGAFLAMLPPGKKYPLPDTQRVLTQIEILARNPSRFERWEE